MKTLIIDDQEFVGRPLAAFLSSTDFSITAAYEATLPAAEDALRLPDFDVLIIDHCLGELHAWDAIPSLKAQCPNLIVVLLSAGLDISTRQKYLDVGVSALVDKRDPAEELIEALEHIGQQPTVYLSPSVELLF